MLGEFLGADCLVALSFFGGIVGISRNSPTTPSICRAKLAADIVHLLEVENLQTPVLGQIYRLNRDGFCII